MNVTGEEIYFFGIIDFLQEYNSRKRSETLLKRLFYNKQEISCVSFVCVQYAYTHKFRMRACVVRIQVVVFMLDVCE